MFFYFLFFFFNDPSTTEIYTLSLHDALPICLPAFLCLDFKTSIDNLPEGHLRFELEGNQICRSSGPTERYASRDARFARRAHPSGPLNPGQGSVVDDRDHHLR